MNLTTVNDWRVHPHGPLTRLEDNLWEVEGELPDLPVGLRRRMVVVRRSDGDLLIHNGVALSESGMRELEALGRPAWLVVPNGWHRIDARRYKARYPDLRVFCPAAADPKVRKVVHVDGWYESLPPDPAVRVETLDGSRAGEGVFVVKSGPEGRVTLVFNDTVFNVPHLPGVTGLVYRVMGSSGGPRVTPMMRLLAVRDARVLAAHLRRLADTPGLVRVVPGHGGLLEHTPGPALRAIADAL